MASIASKNLYELLGNDPELDPDREPEPPTKAIDKSGARIGKRNGGPEPAARDPVRGGRGGRGNNYSGSEQAFRDRGAGSQQNRSKAPEDGARGDRQPDRLRGSDDYRGRGGRGARGSGNRGARGDRQNRTGHADHDKQAAHGWGGESGDAELADEKAGEAMAKQEEGEALAADANNADGDANDAAAELEEKQKSYADYLAEQTEKRLAIGGGSLKERKANEGANKKFPEGREVSREEDDEEYMAGTGGKNRRERARKEKTTVELDDSRLLTAPDRGGRVGTGSGRGGRGGSGSGRGGGRGRGDGNFREGRGRGDGNYRGGRGRGGSGPGSSAPNVSDTNAFPSLG